MLHFIWKRVHTSNSVCLFSILAMEKCWSTEFKRLGSRHFNAIKFFWQMPGERNKRIVLSCFRRASTVVFNPQRTQHGEGSAVQTKRKDRCLLWQRSLKNEGKKACSVNPNGGGDWQLSLPSRGVLSVIRCWDASSAGSSGEDQPLGKPKLTVTRTDVCKWLWPQFHSQNWLHTAALAFCLDSRKSVYWRLNMRLSDNEKN